ncbi:hypothetical protein SLS57_003413 [Botryosphaeria dothidea]
MSLVRPFLKPETVSLYELKCKETAHGEEECREDEEMRSLMLLAQENKWKRCPRCQRMVERIEGCDDMLCVCGAAFCYICGVEWKSGELEDACDCYDDYGSEEELEVEVDAEETVD